METIMKQQLLESLGYIEIARGTTRPVRLDEILQRRMEDFLGRKLQQMNGEQRIVSSKDLY